MQENKATKHRSESEIHLDGVIMLLWAFFQSAKPFVILQLQIHFPESILPALRKKARCEETFRVEA